MKKHVLPLITLFLLASILRLWQLGNIPVSMSDDEIRLSYNAYSISQTGKDINSNKLPLAFVVDSYAFNPIPIYVTSLSVKILGLSQMNARLPFAITGIMTVLLFYGICYQLFKKRSIALFSSLVLVFSPWHLQISRFAYEGEFALFFFALGIFLFLTIKKNTIFQTVCIMLPFLFAFYSYSGTKLLLIPVLLLLWWYKREFLTRKQIVTIILSIFVIFLSFFILTKTQHASSYGSQLFFFQNTSAKVAEAVELERRASLAPHILQTIYHNKLTYLSRIFTEHYAYALSPQFLFLDQEGSGIFSIWSRGELYYIEIPLFVLGFLYLFHKKRKEFVFLLVFLLIAPLPSGLGPDPFTYAIRSSLLLIPLMIFVGSGIYAISYYTSKKLVRNGLYALVIFTYVYFIAGYLTQYYYEWSLYGAKYYSKSTKDVVLLAQEKSKENKKVIVANADNMTLLQFAFYTKLSPRALQSIRQRKVAFPVTIGAVTFQQWCLVIPHTMDGVWKLPQKNTVFIERADCNVGLAPTTVIKTLDGQLIEWKVYEN